MKSGLRPAFFLLGFLFYCYAAAPSGRVRLLHGPAGYAVVGIFDGSLKNGLFR